MSTARRRLRSAVSRLTSLVVPVAVLVAVVATSGSAAAAAGPNDPVGAVESVAASSTTGVQFNGWAADPDALSSNVRVAGYVDGNWASGVATTIARPWIAVHRHTSPTPGFALVVPVPHDGRLHTACVAVGNIGAGLATVLRCVATPLGTALSPGQLAARNPNGALTWVRGSYGTLRVVGWATDPDIRSRRSIVVVDIDGRAVLDVATNYNAAPSAEAGPYSRFDVQIPVSSGTHMACVWAVNVGMGTGNSLVGCGAGDTRGMPGTQPVTTPRTNTLALTEAERHLGQPYVWGAEGPSSFDCSGLVQYSYGKAGLNTARVSADQFRSAHRIWASRAVPGDLVFWYDSSGSVYHVALFVRPGMSFAAIDTAEGVNYEDLRWTTSLSYGSFTHT